MKEVIIVLSIFVFAPIVMVLFYKYISWLSDKFNV